MWCKFLFNIPCVPIFSIVCNYFYIYYHNNTPTNDQANTIYVQKQLFTVREKKSCLLVLCIHAIYVLFITILVFWFNKYGCHGCLDFFFTSKNYTFTSCLSIFIHSSHTEKKDSSYLFPNRNGKKTVISSFVCRGNCITKDYIYVSIHKAHWVAKCWIVTTHQFTVFSSHSIFLVHPNSCFVVWLVPAWV